MKFTVTLTLDVDRVQREYYDLDDESLRGDLANKLGWCASNHLRHVELVSVTDAPLDKYGNPVAREEIQ